MTDETEIKDAFFAAKEIAENSGASHIAIDMTNPFKTKGWVMSIQVMTEEEYEIRKEEWTP